MLQTHNRFQHFLDHEFIEDNNENDDQQLDENEFNENFDSLNMERKVKRSKDENNRSQLRNYWEIPDPDLIQLSENPSKLSENKKKTIVDDQPSCLITKIKSSSLVSNSNSNQSTVQSSNLKQQIAIRFPPQPHKFRLRRSIATHQHYASKRHYEKFPKNLVQSQAIRGNTKCLTHQI